VRAGSVGKCIRFEPYPGYRTCLMSRPQNAGSPLQPRSYALRSPQALPKKVDHRADYLEGCLVVHSQGGCGWCTAHATTAALEAHLCAGKLGYQRISEPHLWYLGQERGEIKNCAGGWYISSAFSSLANETYYGNLLVGGSHWPYSDDVKQLNADRPTDADLKAYGRYGAHWGAMGSVPATDAAALKAALAAGHNVVYSVPTFEATGWHYTDKGYGTIVAPSPSPPGLCACESCPGEPHCLSGYHAMLVVGYDDDDGYFRFLNSWGEWWGDHGYGKIAYDLIGGWGNGGWYTGKLELAKVQDKPPVAVLRYNPSKPKDASDYPWGAAQPAPAIPVGATIHLSSSASHDPEHEKIVRSLTVTGPDGWEVWLDNTPSAVLNAFEANLTGSYGAQLEVAELGPGGQKASVTLTIAVGAAPLTPDSGAAAAPDAGAPSDGGLAPRDASR
jgi:hypothetical protein